VGAGFDVGVFDYIFLQATLGIIRTETALGIIENMTGLNIIKNNTALGIIENMTGLNIIKNNTALGIIE